MCMTAGVWLGPLRVCMFAHKPTNHTKCALVFKKKGANRSIVLGFAPKENRHATTKQGRWPLLEID